MNRVERLAGCLLALCLFQCVSAAAETVWGDLDARYSHIPKIEYDGEVWTLKSRTTSVLILCVGSEAGDYDMPRMKTELAFMAVIDDDAKTITPVELAITIPICRDGVTVPLRDISDAADIFDMEYEELLNCVNALLPGEKLLEHYFILKLDDLEAYDGENAAGDDRQDMLKRRIRTFASYAEGLSVSEQADLLSELSGSIASDLKSGAIVKIADKAERYQIIPTMPIPGELTTDQNGQDWMIMDEQKLLEIVVPIFFEKQ